MAEHDDAVRRGQGISRRELLRRGAIVGGTVAWAAPLIQSLTPPAYAQMGPSPGTCAACYCYSGPKDSPSKDFGTDDGNVGFQLNRDSCENWCKHNGAPQAPGGPYESSEYCSGTTSCEANDANDPGPNGVTCS
jgi:hypothetical protein